MEIKCLNYLLFNFFFVVKFGLLNMKGFFILGSKLYFNVLRLGLMNEFKNYMEIYNKIEVYLNYCCFYKVV